MLGRQNWIRPPRGAALDGLLPLHMAQRNLRLGIVGTAGIWGGKVMWVKMMNTNSLDGMVLIAILNLEYCEILVNVMEHTKWWLKT